MTRAATLLSLAFVCSCSSTTTATPDPNPPSEDAAEDSGASQDTAPEASATYEEAILSSKWAALPKGPKLSAGKQDDVWFTSKLRGFVVNGQMNAIYSTADGGDTWKIAFKNSGTYFRSLVFADATHGFAGNLGAQPGTSITDTNVLYETKDDGATWAPVTTITGSTPSGVCNMHRIDATHLVAVGRVGGPSHMLVSNDAGATWTSTDLGDRLRMLIDARFTSPTEGFVIGGNATGDMKCTILRTTDGGKNWDSVFTSKNGALCWKISFPSADVGYVSIQGAVGAGTFAKTTDGGRTWQEKPLGPKTSYSGLGIGFVTEKIGWISSDKPKQPTYRTTDGGETWTVDPTLAGPINRFRFVDQTTAYAIGGAVWKLDVPYVAP